MRVLRKFDRNRNDVVVAKNLDGTFRTAYALSHDDHRCAPLACTFDVRDPIADATAELHRRLAGHLMNTFFIDRQFLEARSGHHPAGEYLPICKSLGGWQGGDVTARLCFLVAVVQLISQLPRLLANVIELGNQPVHSAGGRGHELDDRHQWCAVVEW